MERRIINRENDFCGLKAMRFAMKDDRFTIKSYKARLCNKLNVIVLRLLINHLK